MEVPDIDYRKIPYASLEYSDDHDRLVVKTGRGELEGKLLSLTGNATISFKSNSWRAGRRGKATDNASAQGNGTVQPGRNLGASFLVQIKEGKLMTLDFASGLIPVTGQKSWSDPDNQVPGQTTYGTSGSYTYGPDMENVVLPAWPRENGSGWTVQVRNTGGGFSGTARLHEQKTSGETVKRELEISRAISFTWDLAGTEEVEVVVEIDGYDRWLPEGDMTDEKKTGDLRRIEATLQTPEGATPQLPAKRFTFELGEVSEEPGVCLNWPKQAAKPPEKDFQFEAKHNPEVKVTDEKGQVAETQQGERFKATAFLSSFDWGASGTLKVTAEQSGNKKIAGYLKGDKGLTKIPLPKRTDGSKIADFWKTSSGAPGLKDDEDEEDDPHGDPALQGHKGDGLSLYEEYRGFRVNGKHACGNPKKKDLQIIDMVGGRSKNGIAVFRSITGLAVQDTLTVDEADADGIVNFNAGTHHLAPKYAIRLSVDPNLQGISFGLGDPGGPKTVKLSSTLSPGPAGWNVVRVGKGKVLTDEYAAKIAHELLHCCGVKHHGLVDKWEVPWSAKMGPDGNPERDASGREIVLEDGSKPIRVIAENGRPVPLILPQTVYLGIKGGQHSGFEDCVMRYAVADAYISVSDASVRYWIAGDEMKGLYLCETPQGTGVNASGRKPQPRYGDATLGRCKPQVCVNDAIKH
ncbi:MAG: hypothetical protein HY717_14710 [Planctomycetes bacterium]|nr:hypothetical protein [Planctomycetota bacterium]